MKGYFSPRRSTAEGRRRRCVARAPRALHLDLGALFNGPDMHLTLKGAQQRRLADYLASGLGSSLGSLETTSAILAVGLGSLGVAATEP